MKNRKSQLFGPFTQIMTMRGLPSSGPMEDRQLEIILNGGIRTSHGKIIEIGDYTSIAKHDDEKIQFDMPSVVIPGLIDAHTHMCFSGSRANDYALRLSGLTYQDIASSGGGILDTVRKTRAATLKELEELLLSRTGQHLRGGVTTCEVKSGYGLNLEDEIKMLQAISNVAKKIPISLIPTCLAAHMKPKEFSSNSHYLNWIIENLLPLVKEKNLSKRVDIFIEEKAFNPQEAFSYLTKAKALGFTLTTHANQFTQGGVNVAVEVGAISADHLEVCTIAEMELMKRNQVIPIILPGASFGLGVPFAPARKMLDIGLPVVIASDWNPGSAPQGALLMQAAILGAYEKLTMGETFAAITYRAAKALQLDDRGRLDTSLRADFVVFNTQDFREILYQQGALLPSAIVCDGILVS